MRRAPKKMSARTHPTAPILSQDEISREAFRIYQSRHGAPGDPVADWFEAERVVMARVNAKPARAAEAQASAGGNGRRSRTSHRRRK